MELFRDHAARDFEVLTGAPWHPRTGSKVNHRALTAAVIDSRDFIAAERRTETEVLLPPGPKIAFTGGLDFNDRRTIWDQLDQVHAKHPDMVLLHGGSPKGAELIAAKWPAQRNVPQIAFKPDWTKHRKAALRSCLFSSFRPPWAGRSVTLDLARRQQAYVLFGAFMVGGTGDAPRPSTARRG
jgi:YspA, cpYpsA-related SLOG family